MRRFTKFCDDLCEDLRSLMTTYAKIYEVLRQFMRRFAKFKDDLCEDLRSLTTTYAKIYEVLRRFMRRFTKFHYYERVRFATPPGLICLSVMSCWSQAQIKEEG